MDPSLFPFLFNNAPLPTQVPTLGGGYMTPDQVAGSVGGNVAAAPPVPITTTPQPGAGATVPGQESFAPAPSPAAATAQAQGGGLGSLGSILQGVKAMTPARQDVKTPAAPHIAAVPAQRAIDLLTSLGIGPQQAVGMGLFRR